MQKQPEPQSPPITQVSGRVRLNVESLGAVMEEIQPLLKQHWAEAGVEKDLSPFDPDWRQCIALEAAGILGIVTLRVNGKLGGYVVCLVGPTLQHKSTVWGLIDGIWLHPKLRRGNLGNKLLQYAEEKMKAAGVKIIKIDTSTRISNWLARKGYTAQHVILTKRLGD